MEETTVEWYAEKEIQLTIDFTQKKINDVEYGIRKLRLIEQAKAMEKKQLNDAYQKGKEDKFKSE